ncbi:MAG: rhodanese-like domain-containing protein [Propionibacteriaceae bacterium]|nr:rhodanese-like domain-containing protein [Propionibacteriaceae bacterium]
MQEVTIAELAAARRDGVVLVDVRETDEYAEGHVPGAIHIPLGLLPHRLGDVPDADPVYVICRSGARSLRGAEALAGAGRRSVSVAGGTMGWIAAGHPVVTGTERG